MATKTKTKKTDAPKETKIEAVTEDGHQIVMLLDPAKVKDIAEKDDVRDSNGTRAKDGKIYDEMKASIKKHGQLEPIGVTFANGTARVVYGQTRKDICKDLGQEVRAIEVPPEAEGSEAFLVAAAENMARRNLSPLEEAAIVARLSKSGKKNAQIARALNRSAPWVTERLRLLKLPTEVKEQLANGELSVAEALRVSYEAQRAAKEDGADEGEAAKKGAKATKQAREKGAGKAKKVRSFKEIMTQLEGKYSKEAIAEIEEGDPEQALGRSFYRKALLWTIYNTPRKKVTKKKVAAKSKKKKAPKKKAKAS